VLRFWNEEILEVPSEAAKRIPLYTTLRSRVLTGTSQRESVVSNCQMVKNVSRGRGKRMRDYLTAYPTTAVINLTGSITRRSLKDYAKLMEWALKDGPPLPKSYYDLLDWADAIDENVPDSDRVAQVP